MKNRTFRIGLIVAILTLVTSCFMGSTFAKYVTNDSASDEARVAKFGVVLTIAGSTADLDLFDAKYDDASNPTVAASDDVNVVAPGTSKTLAAFSITGTPEVMVDVEWTCTLTLSDNWKVDGDDYCPLVITVDTKDYYIGGTYLDNTTPINSVATLKAAVEEAVVKAHSKDNVAPNTDLADQVKIGWKWNFNGTDHPKAGYQTDVKDTKLGDKAVAEDITISLAVSCTVTQVD